MNLTITQVLTATVFSSIIVFSTRLFPFVVFSSKEPPRILKFIEKYIPVMAMAILLVYCLKDVNYSTSPYGIPQLVALTITVILHLWKSNSLLSIGAGTVIFMILIRL